MKKLTVITSTALAYFATQAIAGPFGLEMGMKASDFPGAKSLGKGTYELKSVPKPHSAFDRYAVRISPTTGVCWIKGLGADLETSVYGVELRIAFEGLRNKLEQAYGPYKLTDRLLPGSIWNEPKDFMMSMAKRERVLLAQWDRANGSKLPEDIDHIGLIATADNSTTGNVMLEYSMANKASCTQELAAAEDSAL